MDEKEKERRQLNKKLIKQMFVSGMKEQGKVYSCKQAFEIILLCVSIIISDIIVQAIAISSHTIELIVQVILICVICKISEVIIEKIIEARNKNI
jgi:hypothetical protein